jgi:hypothetical protein
MAGNTLSHQGARSYVFRHLVVEQITSFENAFTSPEVTAHAHEWYKGLALFVYPEDGPGEDAPDRLAEIKAGLDELAAAVTARDLPKALKASQSAFAALLTLNAAFEPAPPLEQSHDETSARFEQSAQPVNVTLPGDAASPFVLTFERAGVRVRSSARYVKLGTTIDYASLTPGKKIESLIDLIDNGRLGSITLPDVAAFELPGHAITPLGGGRGATKPG